MTSRLPIDELNVLRERLKIHFDERGHIKSRKDCEDIIDELLDLFLLYYAEGVEGVNEQFSTDIEPSAQEIQETVYRRIDGATWRDRVLAWYASDGTMADIVRIAETEAHRIGNTAAHETAVKAGATTKTWRCMMLPTSRDTHIYLDGTTVPIDGYFYSYKGGKTQFPGEWGIAEEDCNCLCICDYR